MTSATAGLDIAYRATDIASDEVERFGGFRRESADLSIGTDHHYWNIDTRQEIGQIIGELIHFDVPGLQLIIDRCHFFVGGLQFFLGGLQFLIGTL